MNEISRKYNRLKWQSFSGIFIGYAAYYLVRKNFALAKPYLIEQGYSIFELGAASTALPLAYGLSKFIMGNVSDRSNPKYFMSIGLVLSSLILILLGGVDYCTQNIYLMALLLFANGWVQGMGWPASAKVIVYWFSYSQRATKMSFWNIAHNIGGALLAPLASLGIILFTTWKSIFFFPAFISLTIAIVIFYLIKSKPTDYNLPKVESYAFENTGTNYKHYKSKEIFWKIVLSNKKLWLIAMANAFVYFIRYGVLDWAPTYLKLVKGFDTQSSHWAFFTFEFAAIPGTLLCGYVSDKYFKGKRTPVSNICLIMVILNMCIYWLNPTNEIAIDLIALFGIGFFIYGPVMLIGVQALDIVPENAVGTAAGFTGLWGYMGGAIAAEILLAWLLELGGWNTGFIALLLAGLIAIILLYKSEKDEG